MWCGSCTMCKSEGTGGAPGNPLEKVWARPSFFQWNFWKTPGAPRLAYNTGPAPYTTPAKTNTRNPSYARIADQNKQTNPTRRCHPQRADPTNPVHIIKIRPDTSNTKHLCNSNSCPTARAPQRKHQTPPKMHHQINRNRHYRSFAKTWSHPNFSQRIFWSTSCALRLAYGISPGPHTAPTKTNTRNPSSAQKTEQKSPIILARRRHT